jgi:predicted nucleic acid-binding protein
MKNTGDPYCGTAASIPRRDALAVPSWCRIQVCRDPRDDMVLEVAVDGRADYVVTGDQDLLVLHPFEEIPIVKPATFLERIDASQG